MRYYLSWTLALICSLPLFLDMQEAPAWAWGNAGHQTIAYMASKHLKPGIMDQIIALIHASDPTFVPTPPTTPNPTFPVLPKIATWPDEVRSNPDFHFSAPFHFADAMPHVTEQNFYDSPTQAIAPEGDVVQALIHYEDILRDKSKPLNMRGDALKFIVHLVGDAHQPLHCGRKEDRGGNDIKIQTPLVFGDSKTDELHAVWDDAILIQSFNDHISPPRGAQIEHKLPNNPGPTILDMTAIQPFGDALEALDAQISPDTVKLPLGVGSTNNTFVDWVNESHAFAEVYGYADERGPISVSGAFNPNALPHLLTSEYYKRTVPVLIRRITQASQRLASILNRDLAPFPAPLPPAEQAMRLRIAQRCLLSPTGQCTDFHTATPAARSAALRK